MSESLPLRDYQKAAISSIDTAFQHGSNKQVAVLATGLGKTVIFSHLISERIMRTGKKALILAHREELLLQAKDKLSQINSNLRIGIEQADSNADHLLDDVVIASVATIGSANSKRLLAFDPKQYSTVIVDEAHHASATSYRNVFQHFGILKNSADWNTDILFLGVTATPNRNDNKGIDEIFDDVVYTYDIIDGIQNGWLSHIRAVRIDTDTDISKVHQVAGDFNAGELASTINTLERNALVVKTYEDMAKGKQALVFAADVAHTLELYESFTKAGIPTAYVIGSSEKHIRKDVLEKFARKEIHVMVNAMVLTEGYDNAGIEFVFMARPTQSGILYQQMIGRGTRTSEGKDHLMVVDFVDNTSNHSLKTTASLFGIDEKIDFQGEDILVVKKYLDELRDRRPFYDLDRLDVKKIPYLIQEVDILQNEKANKPIKNYEWFSVQDATRMKIGEDIFYTIEQSLTGRYMLHEDSAHGVSPLIATFDSRSDAMKYVTELISQKIARVSSTSPSNTWDADIPSEAQIQLLRNMNVSEDTIIMLDRGSASRLISSLKGSQRS